jgi:hypothetical protein
MPKTKSTSREIKDYIPKLKYPLIRDFGSLTIKKKRIDELKAKQRLEGWERDELKMLLREY